jgi:hypothetical protein
MPRAMAFAMMACTISGAICSLDVVFIEFTSGYISLISIHRYLELRNSLRGLD